ncbi:ImmA/IrrE family metallo-endopeptidase [Brevibacillus humidisoli]|uniref:ImmA/IrrE family metallo-endopeptidase n=1 Tax=Brevibacillus humidisoli TaxID=2895522 RepID=UPI001E5407A2|nr:ImmA/IrrE family metallo-endopeptidase [Brevibacillus humidisoli]UFJ42026.1 ImmA/IrrE family metallo-endopeptidase [Brevibacillus humidisoli]
MLLFYRPTALEAWVVQFYRRLRIEQPEDLAETEIAHSLNIYLSYRDVPSLSYEMGRFKSITIDSRMPSQVQREHFFHELCHLLRHAGRQSMMPAAFRELQERDAHHFTRYAALPLHMLLSFDFRDPGIIENLTERFRVTPELCQKRLEKIRHSLQCGNCGSMS